jgi:hypothetical protein
MTRLLQATEMKARLLTAVAVASMICPAASSLGAEPDEAIPRADLVEDAR